MRDKAEGRDILLNRRRYIAVYIGMHFVQPHIFRAHCLQFIPQHTGKDKLFFRAGYVFRFRRLCVNRNVTQEFLFDAFHNDPFRQASLISVQVPSPNTFSISSL